MCLILSHRQCDSNVIWNEKSLEEYYRLIKLCVYAWSSDFHVVDAAAVVARLDVEKGIESSEN